MIVAASDEETHGSRFQEGMDAFTAVALDAVAKQKHALTETKALFSALLSFYRFKGKTASTPPTTQDFFELWAGFCEGFAEGWRAEQRAQARRRLEAAQLVQRQMKEQAKAKKVWGGR